MGLTGHLGDMFIVPWHRVNVIILWLRRGGIRPEEGPQRRSEGSYRRQRIHPLNLPCSQSNINHPLLLTCQLQYSAYHRCQPPPLRMLCGCHESIHTVFQVFRVGGGVWTVPLEFLRPIKIGQKLLDTTL